MTKEGRYAPDTLQQHTELHQKGCGPWDDTAPNMTLLSE